MMPLVPPDSAAVAEVDLDVVFQPAGLVMSKDMRQPLVAAGHLTGFPVVLVPVTLLPVTLKKIKSVPLGSVTLVI